MRRALVATACFVLAAAPARGEPLQAQRERMVMRYVVRSGVHYIDLTPGARLPVRIGLKAPPAPVVNSRTTGPSPGGGGLSSVPSGPLYLSEAQVVSYLRVAGFPESVIPTMLGYAKRESNLCPTAVYPGHCVDGYTVVRVGGAACGLLQLNPCYGGAAWLDPMANVRAAYAKYRAAGLSPWGG